MKNTIILWIFFAIAMLELGSEVTQNQILTYITKPLLMTSLSIYYWLVTADNRNRFSKLLFIGLLFSIGGDTYLMFEGNLFFMLGLGCFLFTHLYYTAAFLSFHSLSRGFIRQQPWLIIILTGYLFGIMSYLWADLRELKIPVFIYGTVISIMALAAVNLKSKVPKHTFIILISGVILFIFSDSIIALSKFKSDFLITPYRNFIIMSTYIAAQYLIVRSAVTMNKLLENRD